MNKSSSLLPRSKKKSKEKKTKESVFRLILDPILKLK